MPIRTPLCVLVVPCLMACIVDLEVPESARIRCSSNARCVDDLVCRGGLCRSPDLEDLEAPQITDVLLSDAVVGLDESSAPRVVSLTIELDEPASLETSRAELSVPGDPRELRRTSDSAPQSLTFDYTPTGDEPQLQPIAFTLVVEDEFGNRATLPVGETVTFDFEAPRIVSTPPDRAPSILLRPDVENPLFDRIIDADFPSAANRATEVLVTFETDELVESARVYAPGVDGLDFEAFSVAGVVRIVRLVWPDAIASGRYALRVELTDFAGNRSDVPLDVELEVDVEAPAPPSRSALRLERAPWGRSEFPSSTILTLSAPAGSFEGSATVRVYADRDRTTVLAQGEADASGALSDLELQATDRTSVYVQGFDDAGNPSDQDAMTMLAEPTEIGEVDWTAAFARETAGDNASNPHRFVARPIPIGDLRDQFGDTEFGEVDGLAAPDGAYAMTEGAGRWHRADYDTGVLQSAVYGAAGYDPRSGTTVVFGGASFSQTEPGPTPFCDGAVATASERGRWSTGWQSVGSQGDVPPAALGYTFVFAARDGLMLLAGGQGSTASLGLWSYEDGIWRELCAEPPCSENAPPPSSDATVAYDLYRSTLVVHVESTWEWDGVVWRQPCGQASCEEEPPQGGIATFDESLGEVLVFAGGETWSWDGERWQERCTESPCRDTTPSAREGASMVYDPVRRETLLFGGSPGGCSLFVPEEFQITFSDTWVYRDGRWQERNPTTRPGDRRGHRLVFDGGRREVVLVGGTQCDCQELATGTAGSTARQSWSWDGADWTLRPDRPSFVEVPTGSSGHETVFHASAGATQWENVTVLYGGATDRRYRWTGETWERWNNPIGEAGRLPGDFVRFNAGFVAPNLSEEPILFGGFRSGSVTSGSGAATNTAFRIRADGWTGLSTGPVARLAHAMAGDGEQVIVFGGTEYSTIGDEGEREHFGALLDDTWAFDGANWNAVCAACDPKPSARSFSAMAPTGIDGEVVLFGGGTGYRGPLGDTWIFDRDRGIDGEWRSLDSQSPAARADHALAFDPWRAGVVLFGGADLLGQDGRATSSGTVTYPRELTDVWEFGDNRWVRPPVSDPEGDGDPVGRRGHSLSADPTSRAMLSFGGDETVGEPPPVGGFRFPNQIINGRGNGNQETWLWYGEDLSAPMHIVEISTLAAGEGDDLVLSDLIFAWRGRAVSTDPSGVETTAVELMVWNGVRWETLTDGIETVGEQWTWRASQDPAFPTTRLRSLATGVRRIVRFAARPSGTNGPSPKRARLETDYGSVTLRYPR